MQKKIMFIGAGPYQLKGIEKAKSMGLFVITTDGNPDAAGLKIADLSYVLDVKDLEANLKIAKENFIDGVLAIASEVSIKTVSYISQVLGLPGINLEVAEKCTDKELMRKAFFDFGVPTPKSEVVLNLEDLLYEARKIGFPVVVKPADSAGSRGVRKVDKENDLAIAFREAMKYTGKQKVLVEEFMDGVESSAEAFAYNGEIHILALSDKIRTSPPHLLDTTVIFPSAYPEDVQKKMFEIAKDAIRAVGINIGPIHLEMMMTKRGPIPVELAARGPGFKVFTDILPRITGIDILAELIRCALGEEPNLTPNANFASVLKFLEVKPGRIKRILNLKEAREIQGIYELEIYKKEGDTVRPLTCGDDRIGHIISFAKSREEAINIIKKVESVLKIEVE